MINFIGESKQISEGLVKNEKEALDTLLNHETVVRKKEISLYVNNETDKYPVNDSCVSLQIEDNHITKASFYNCLKAIGAVTPRELKECKNLKELYFENISSFITFVNLNASPSLEKLSIYRCPRVKLYATHINRQLQELSIIESEFMEIEDMDAVPCLKKLDLSYSPVIKIEGLDVLTQLEKFCIRKKGFFRNLCFYLANKGRIKALEERGVEVIR